VAPNTTLEITAAAGQMKSESSSSARKRETKTIQKRCTRRLDLCPGEFEEQLAIQKIWAAAQSLVA